MPDKQRYGNPQPRVVHDCGGDVADAGLRERGETVYWCAKCARKCGQRLIYTCPGCGSELILPNEHGGQPANA